MNANQTATQELRDSAWQPRGDETVVLTAPLKDETLILNAPLGQAPVSAYDPNRTEARQDSTQFIPNPFQPYPTDGPARPNRSRRGLIAGLLVAGLLVVAGGAYVLRGNPSSEVAQPTDEAAITLDAATDPAASQPELALPEPAPSDDPATVAEASSAPADQGESAPLALEQPATAPSGDALELASPAAADGPTAAPAEQAAQAAEEVAQATADEPTADEPTADAPAAPAIVDRAASAAAPAAQAATSNSSAKSAKKADRDDDGQGNGREIAGQVLQPLGAAAGSALNQTGSLFRR